MLDPDIAALIGAPAAAPSLTPETIARLRLEMRTIGAALPGCDLADVRELDAAGVPVRLYRPDGEGALPLLVFLHGGGWFLGDLDTHDAMCRLLATQADCTVLAVGYRLAPEHRFPAGLNDVAIAFAWARREAAALGCDPVRIALGGESAGGNLTAALTLRLREAREAQPLFQLLVHPATDLTLDTLAQVESAGITRDYLLECVSLYADAGARYDPLVSPMQAARHERLPPAIVLTAAEDPLRDDGERYSALLAAAGVETLVQRLPGLPHGFMFLPATIPAVANSFALIARLIRRYFAIP